MKRNKTKNTKWLALSSSAAYPFMCLGGVLSLGYLQLFAFMSVAQAQSEPLAYSEIPPIAAPVLTTIPPVEAVSAVVTNVPGDEKIYPKVFINNETKNLVGEFIRRNGTILVTPQELEEIGLKADPKAKVTGGLIDLRQLPNVTYHYNVETQTLEFQTSDLSALMPTKIQLWRMNRPSDEDVKTDSTFGAVVNYTLYADSGDEKFGKIWDFQGVSAQLDARVFGKFGTFSSNQIVRFASGDYSDAVRLETAWSYQDEKRLISYTAGDLTTRGLSWTRPVRMGGGQIRRNFALRSDLVTMPLPSISGSAAVPSAVDVYLNNVRRSTSDVPVGPYSVTDFPVVTGANTARMVVRDALGRETVTEVPFYASNDMLAKGFVDFSMEGGFLRYFYGSESNKYGNDFAASATVRYGLTDNLTLEGHGEYVGDLYNGGLGTVFNVGSFGALSLAYAGSSYRGHTGQQVAANFSMEKWGLHLNARSQRTFGDYEDMASTTARMAGKKLSNGKNADDNYYSGSARPPKALDQVSVSMPLKFDPTTLNLSFTQAEYHNAEKSKLVSLSASRSFSDRIFGHVSAYKDLKKSDNYGIFAGLSISFGNGTQLSSSVNSDNNGTYAINELSKSEKQEIGSTGWRLRDVEGSRTNRSASGSYRGRYARVQGSVEQAEDSYRATAEVEGSIVVAGGGVFAAPRIDDSFAIVDVGAAGVPVLRNNQPYGKTGRNGKLIVPDLWSYQETQLGIDPTNMPLDSLATTTRLKVKPGYRTGVIANFDIEESSESVLVSLLDQSGKAVPMGSAVMDSNEGELAFIGYDGQTLLPLNGVSLPANFTVKLPGQKLCRFTVPANVNKGVSEGVTALTCVVTDGH